VLYSWLLPLLWGSGCWFGWQYPGEEHLLWLMGSIGGAWVAVINPDIGETTGILPVVLLTGAVLMLFVGALMDFLRVSFLLFTTLLVLAGGAVAWFTISRFPSYQAALDKNGSLQAYLLFGGMIGLYVSVASASAWRILTLLLAPLGKRESVEPEKDWQWRSND
jgi:hypothetical protein